MSKTLQWISPGDPVEQIDPTLAPGQRVQVQSSHTGIRSELYKCVYVDGVLTERTLLNKDNYNSSKAIYRVGPAAPAEPAPAEPAPAETAPAESVPTVSAPTEAAPAGPGAAAGPGSTANGPGGMLGPAGPGAEAPAPASPIGPGATQGP